MIHAWLVFKPNPSIEHQNNNQAQLCGCCTQESTHLEQVVLKVVPVVVATVSGIAMDQLLCALIFVIPTIVMKCMWGIHKLSEAANSTIVHRITSSGYFQHAHFILIVGVAKRGAY